MKPLREKPTEKQVVIYLGPSLPLQSAMDILDADYRPPVKRGDLEALLSAPPCAIGIIDGLFAQNLSISTKEILRMIDKGVAVFGASSMGALRAAELYPYGMRGVGTIFEMYRSGRIDADDEVAMIHDDDWQPLSEPMVNIRWALEGAFQAGIISGSEKRYLLHSTKKLYFPERSYNRLLQMARQKFPEETYLHLKTYIEQQRPNMKSEDARLLLKEVGRYQ
jgi:hypothetical protein